MRAIRLFGLVLAGAMIVLSCSNQDAGDRPPSEAAPETGVAVVADSVSRSEPRTNLGSIAGHAVLSGKPPGNRVIRMGMDPKCALITQGKMVTEEGVVTSRDGSLANVFVHLDGEFPHLPPSTQPVRIDQSGCTYVPHVVGVQVGQTVEVRNGDDLLHNLHASSRAGNGFNVSQPQAGMVYRFQAMAPETMLQLACDVHRWMRSYIGIVDHPFFAVTSPAGDFGINEVPAGTYTIRAWHETYGELTQMVEVRTGETATVSFQYEAK